MSSCKTKGKTATILHFCCDETALILRARLLTKAGYRVLNSSNGFETIQLSIHRRVNAVLLDLDHCRHEVKLIAQEIKKLRPEVPTLMLTDGRRPMDGFDEMADALVLKEAYLCTLVERLDGALRHIA